MAGNDVILQAISPNLRPVFQKLWIDGKIGISSAPVNIRPYPAKVKDDEVLSYSDRFSVEIPYAGKFLKWDMLFNDEDYNFAPDFVFSDQFLADPDIDIIEKQIPSLANWDANDPNCLQKVLQEILLLYKKYQLEKLQSENKFTRQATEYLTLTSDFHVSEKDVEVFVDNHCVHFLISMDVDFSELPPYAQPAISKEKDFYVNPCEVMAMLKMTFYAARVNGDLQLSPQLEQVIGTSKNLLIPNYTKNTVINEFVILVQDLLKEKVAQICRHFRMKNEFVSTLLVDYRGNVVEYDSHQYSWITLIAEVNGFHMLVYIGLDDLNFPNKPPCVTMKSVYHLHNNKPMEHTFSKFPYDSTWTAKEIISQLFSHLHELIPEYGEYCQNKVN